MPTLMVVLVAACAAARGRAAASRAVARGCSAAACAAAHVLLFSYALFCSADVH